MELGHDVADQLAKCLELLALAVRQSSEKGGGQGNATAAPAGSPLSDSQDPGALGPAALDAKQLAARFGRSTGAVKAWLRDNRFPGAYRLRGREWRVPISSVAAFEAAERQSEDPSTLAVVGVSRRPLSAWRRVRRGAP
jgi:hypothetical protein